MRFGSALLALAAIGPLAAAAARPGTPSGPGADVACLSWQTEAMDLPYTDALARCHAPAMPDLTGDEELQRQARSSRQPFLVRRPIGARLRDAAGSVIRTDFRFGPVARPGTFHLAS